MVGALVVIDADGVSDGGSGANAEHGAGYGLVDAGHDFADCLGATGAIDTSLLIDSFKDCCVRVEVMAPKPSLVGMTFLVFCLRNAATFSGATLR